MQHGGMSGESTAAFADLPFVNDISVRVGLALPQTQLQTNQGRWRPTDGRHPLPC